MRKEIVELLKLTDNIEEILKIKEQFHLRDEEIIQILCQIEKYEKIGGIVVKDLNGNNKLYPIDSLCENLNSEEKILTCLSIIHDYTQELVKLDNISKENLTPGIRMKALEFSQLIRNATSVIRMNVEGIKNLFFEHNLFFDENFPKIVNFNFLNNSLGNNYWHGFDDLVSFLYQHGYSQMIKNHLSYFDSCILEELFSHDEIKEELLSLEFLRKNMEFPEYFEILPPNKKSLVAYYGCEFFETNNYSERNRETARIHLKNLFQLHFQGILSDDLQDKIMNLYGKVSSDVIESVIRKAMIDENCFDKIERMASIYLDGDVGAGFVLDEKYPNIAQTLFLGECVATDLLKEKIVYLCQKPILEGIDTIEDILFKGMDDLKKINYDVHHQNNKKSIYGKISPDNISKFKLFNYQNEILIIDIEGNVFEFDVVRSHPDTLCSAYYEIIDEDKNEQDVTYEANMMGDAIFIIENAGVILYLPPTISSNQKIKLLEKIKHLENHERKEEIVIYSGFAIPNTKCEYVYFNAGDEISTLELMNEICKLKVDDEGKVLHSKESKQVKK